MEEAKVRDTKPVTVKIISKEQFCKIMNAIYKQEEIANSVCSSLSQMADIFTFDGNNLYRQELGKLLAYLFDDTGDWIGYWMYEAQWKPFSWWDAQDVEHTVSSLEELYDFLIDNLLAHQAFEEKRNVDI